MWFRKKQKVELDSKSRAIALMYLHNSKSVLEEEVNTKKRTSESGLWTANHDIKCLERTIRYIENA